MTVDAMAPAALLIGLCGLAFAISIWVGILVGRRLDRVIQARAGAGEPESDEEVRGHE